MATKKAKRMAVKKAESYSAPAAGIQHIQDWLLIILGGLGLATTLGYIVLPGFDSYFQYVWPVLVLVIGITNLMNKNSC